MTADGLINIKTKAAEAKLALWGATLLSFRPQNETHDVLWLGARNKFDGEHAIRGGVPISWPRFAEEELNNHLPRHGFARVSEWRVVALSADENKAEMELILSSQPQYNLAVTAKLTLKIGEVLEYYLETTNNSDTPFEFSEALHAYFNISSLANVTIKGLKGQKYKNSLTGNSGALTDDINIAAEFDSIFLRHAGAVEIEDRGFNRVISIEKIGSQTTVVWNPYKDLAEMAENQHKTFVCVEPSNVGDYHVKLAPHTTHQIGMKIKVKKLNK